jgi:hypothetical protein
MASTARCVSENEGRSEPAVVNWIERGSFTPQAVIWARWPLRTVATLPLLVQGAARYRRNGRGA